MTLDELIQSGRMTIGTDEAAKIIGINPVTLRNSIQMGTCPFGFEASAPRSAKRFYVVSVLKLVNWLTCSHYTNLGEWKGSGIWNGISQKSLRTEQGERHKKVR